MGHLRIHFRPCFKASLSEKSLLWISVFIHTEITNNHNKKISQLDSLWKWDCGAVGNDLPKINDVYVILSIHLLWIVKFCGYVLRCLAFELWKWGWRRANARNVSFSIPVRWSIYIINSVDKPNFRLSIQMAYLYSGPDCTVGPTESKSLFLLLNQNLWSIYVISIFREKFFSTLSSKHYHRCIQLFSSQWH